MFPSGPQASMRWCRRCIGFGLKPDHETQRFWPCLHWRFLPSCFSQGKTAKVRTRRGARNVLPGRNDLDLLNSGAGCYSTRAAGVVVRLGRTQSSRKTWPLSPCPAGAAHGSGSEDKQATLTPSVPKPSGDHVFYVRNDVNIGKKIIFKLLSLGSLLRVFCQTYVSPRRRSWTSARAMTA
jgi:hypothetical protein